MTTRINFLTDDSGGGGDGDDDDNDDDEGCDVGKSFVSGSVINLLPLMRGDFYSRINHGYASRCVRSFFFVFVYLFFLIVSRLTMHRRRYIGTSSCPERSIFLN